MYTPVFAQHEIYTQQLNDEGYSFKDIAVSQDGTKVSIVSEEYILISYDGGLNWINVADNVESGADFILPNLNQSESVAYSEETESFYYGASFSGVSTLLKIGDNPTSFSTTTIPGGGNRWQDIHVSNGTIYLLAARVLGQNIKIFKTSDEGQTWNIVEVPNTNAVYRTNFSFSADNSKIAIATENGILLSDDSGDSWVESEFESPENKRVTMNDDGSVLVVSVGFGPGIMLSYDFGETWIETTNTLVVDNDWKPVMVTGDGSMILAGFGNDYEGFIYYSYDGGDTWYVIDGTGLGYWEMDFADNETKIFAINQENGDFVRISLDQDPTVISSFAVVSAQTTASITFNTDESVVSTFSYGTTTSYGTDITTGTSTTSHTVELTNLSYPSTYYYKITTVDILGNETNLTGTFTTSLPLSTAPSSRSGSRKQVTKAPTTSPSVNTPTTPPSTNNTPASPVERKEKLASNPRDLEQNTEGEDVRLLQQFLNQQGFLINTPGQVGSTGYETTYFGNLTRQALIKFQQTHNITPAAGYFGPKTRALIKTLQN